MKLFAERKKVFSRKNTEFDEDDKTFVIKKTDMWQLRKRNFSKTEFWRSVLKLIYLKVQSCKLKKHW